ncbi:MAG: acetylxylan esterase [Clostridiales bacterium]|nr:acetylxylan esterase [Clostridiales bacterium]
MPLIDMPLEELLEYGGRNPRPDDFDAFWERGLAEMRSARPDVELAPAPLATAFADCFDMTFTGARGARVYAKLLKPRGRRSGCPALLAFHGYSGSSGDWVSYMPYAAQGYVVAALDCRGQGGRSEDAGGYAGTTYEGHFIRGLDGKPDDMLMRHVMLDTAQLARLVMDMPEVDETRVMAEGGSQGGGLALACAALEPGVSRVAAAFPFLSDYQRVWEMDLATSAYDEIKYYFRHYDPLHLREKAIFTQLGYIDVQHLAPRIRGRALMACGLMDQVCPPSTQFAAYNRIASEKELRIYPDFGHEGLPGWADASFAFLTAGA